ncbi:MAG TPA: hypothetical protein VKA40_08400 [Nitrososphaera sp.]|jgi:hypothetical protein|nr:hypothetical protein [Nitrososphaera sp.]
MQLLLLLLLLLRPHSSAHDVTQSRETVRMDIMAGLHDNYYCEEA